MRKRIQPYFLQVGDVIELKKGMMVYTELPAKFVYSNRAFSDKLTDTNITVGEIRTLFLGEINKDLSDVVGAVYEALESIGVKPDKNKCAQFVYDSVPAFKEDSWIFPPGRFLVIRTNEEGGGDTLGMSGRESWPDGHRVFCQKLGASNKLLNVFCNFYQTGCFTAMIEKISPIGKMKKTETWE